MKRRCCILVILCLGLLWSAATSAAEPFWAEATFVNGGVTYVAKGEKAEQSLKRGAVLHKGDFVKAAQSSQASFLLSSGGILVVRAGTEVVLGETKGAQESASLQAVAKNLSKTLLSREGDNPMLKHLGGLRGGERNIALAPCRTKVRLPVELVWFPKAGVSKYAVSLMGPDGSVFESTVAATRMQVPPDKLAPGATFFWEVRDAASKDTFTPLGSGSFTTLDVKSEGEVRSLEKGVDSALLKPSGPDDTTALFLSYQIYRENGLGLEALAALHKMTARSPDDQELQRWRRDLCTEMGLEEQDVPAIFPAK